MLIITFSLGGILNKASSRGSSSPPPPQYMPSVFSRPWFSVPTARRFASNPTDIYLFDVLVKPRCKILLQCSISGIALQ